MHYWDMESDDLNSKLKFYTCMGGGKRYKGRKAFPKVIQSFVLQGIKFYYSDLSQSRTLLLILLLFYLIIYFASNTILCGMMTLGYFRYDTVRCKQLFKCYFFLWIKLLWSVFYKLSWGFNLVQHIKAWPYYLLYLKLVMIAFCYWTILYLDVKHSNKIRILTLGISANKQILKSDLSWGFLQVQLYLNNYLNQTVYTSKTL